MKTTGILKPARRRFKQISQVTGSIFIFLQINSCSNIQENIYYFQDPSSTYQYIFNKHGILKARHDPNQLVLFDPCLKEIQLSDNIAFNYPYKITGWKNDTIELCLILTDSDWDFYKQKYYRIRNYNSFIGNYFIRYSHKPITEWITGADTIDSFRINIDDFTLQIFNKGNIKDDISINNLWFSDKALEYKTDDSKTGRSKKIQLTNGLTNKTILSDIISKYKQSHCK